MTAYKTGCVNPRVPYTIYQNEVLRSLQVGTNSGSTQQSTTCVVKARAPYTLSELSFEFLIRFCTEFWSWFFQISHRYPKRTSPMQLNSYGHKLGSHIFRLCPDWEVLFFFSDVSRGLLSDV